MSEQVAITFSKGLSHEFKGKNGKDYVGIKVPELDWAEFVVSAQIVHDSKKNPDKSSYVYLDADREITLQKSVVTGEKDGVKEYSKMQKKVSPQEIKDAFDKGYEKYKASQGKEAKAAEAADKDGWTPFEAELGE